MNFNSMSNATLTQLADDLAGQGDHLQHLVDRMVDLDKSVKGFLVLPKDVDEANHRARLAVAQARFWLGQAAVQNWRYSAEASLELVRRLGTDGGDV